MAPGPCTGALHPMGTIRGWTFLGFVAEGLKKKTTAHDIRNPLGGVIRLGKVYGAEMNEVIDQSCCKT